MGLAHPLVCDTYSWKADLCTSPKIPLLHGKSVGKQTVMVEKALGFW